MSFEISIWQFLQFSRKTFRKATPSSSLIKLKEEISEVEKELSNGKNIARLEEEYADCLMCLFDSANRCGISIDDLVKAFDFKLEKNLRRKWTLNDDNTYSHDKY